MRIKAVAVSLPGMVVRRLLVPPSGYQSTTLVDELI